MLAVVVDAVGDASVAVMVVIVPWSIFVRFKPRVCFWKWYFSPHTSRFGYSTGSIFALCVWTQRGSYNYIEARSPLFLFFATTCGMFQFSVDMLII